MRTCRFSQLAVVLVLALALALCLAPTALAADQTVSIAQADTVAQILTRIQTAINDAESGDTITVTGSKSGADVMLSLDIPAGVKVVWMADYAGGAGALIGLEGAGTFEVAGGTITARRERGYAINSNSAKVTVSGGEVSAIGKDGVAILTDSGEVTVTGGTVVSNEQSISISSNFGIITASGQDDSGSYYLVNGNKVYSSPINISLPAVICYTLSNSGIVLEKVLVEFGTDANRFIVDTAVLTTLKTAYDANDVEYCPIFGELVQANLTNNSLVLGASRISIRETYLYDMVKENGGWASDTDNVLLSEIINGRFGAQTLALVDKDNNALLVALCSLVPGGGGPGPGGGGIIVDFGTAIYSVSGDVTVSGGTVAATGSFGSAIHCINGKVIIADKAKIEATGKEGLAIRTNDGEITVSGGEVTATGLGGVAVQADSGEVKVIGGKVSATGDYFYEENDGYHDLSISMAINTRDGDITVSNGTVSATGDAGIAIYTTKGVVKVSGGTVSASGDFFCKEMDDHSRYYNTADAISTEFGDINISGGTVSASGKDGKAICTVYGKIAFSNGTVLSTGKTIFIYSYDGEVTISGGTVESSGEEGCAIISYGNVSVTGGTVEATGKYGLAICTAGENSITKISGGTVRGETAIAINYGGVAAYWTGTCFGEFYIDENLGLVVEVASLNAGTAGTSTGLTVRAGAGSARWIADGFIEFTLGGGLPTKTLYWGEPVGGGTDPVGPGGGGGGGSTDASISPSKADFDLNSNKDISVTLTLNGKKLNNLKNGAYTLKQGTDYTVSGNTVTIKASYLSTLPAGAQTILFEMNGGKNPQLTITVTDSSQTEGDKTTPDVFAAFIEGFEDNTFCGNSQITREQFVTILFRLKNPQPTDDPAEAGEPSFKDVAPDRWSYEEIEWAKAAGIVDADEEGNFRPAEALTRAEMAIMLVKADGLSEMAANTFNDIAEHAAKDDILKAAKAKIFIGYPDGSFKPDGHSTRYEAVTALVRYLLGGEPTDAMWQGIELEFSDVARSHWAYRYVALAVSGL